MVQTRRAFCGLCHPRCGVRLRIENDRAIGVEGDPDHPISRGRLCARGRLLVDHLYHPARLNYPLKRTGERGANEWQRLSWDQALDEVAERLGSLRNQYGPETLAFTHGTQRTYHWDGRRFFNLFGSPNLCGANNICMCPSHAVEYATYGGFARGDIGRTKCLVVWGNAPSQSDPILGFPEIVAAKKNGAKLIVVDPRRTREAELADWWLPIRPGTDVALMLGWLRLMIEEGWYDRDFVERWTVGFEDLRAAVAPYTPDKVSAITWLSPEQICESARCYATTKPAVITWGFGLDKQGVNATQAARARCLLRALSGNLDVPGGELLGRVDPVGKIVGQDVMEFNEALPPQQRAKQLGADEYPFFGFPGWERNVAANRRLPPGYMSPPLADMTCMAHKRAVFEAILTGRPYPVTAMISLASNPLVTLPNVQRTYAALKALQLYVVMDYYLTPSAALADYVFPAASTVERTELWLTPSFCLACPKGIGPLYERRDDYQFWRGLATRLGQAEHWPWQTVEEVWDYRLAPAGLTFRRTAGAERAVWETGLPAIRTVRVRHTVREGGAPLEHLRGPRLCAGSRLPRARPQSRRRLRLGARVPLGAHHRQPVHAHVPLRAAALGGGAGRDARSAAVAAPGYGGGAGAGRGRLGLGGHAPGTHPPPHPPHRRSRSAHGRCAARLVVSRALGGGTGIVRRLRIQRQYALPRRSEVL